MNYLAHIFLSGNTPEMQIGGLLGDFVKGPLSPEKCTPFYPGIMLHRRIDAHLDKLETFNAALATIPSPYRRYGGIILDILFDHYLAKNWSNRHPDPLDDFCQQFYRQLDNYFHRLPPGAQRFARIAPEVNWLQNYQHFSNLPRILKRVAERFSRPVDLEGSVAHIETAYDSLYLSFQSIFPEVEQFAKEQRSILLRHL